MLKVKIHTTGCRTNQAESEALARDLQQRGFRVVQDGVADIYVINACTVTAKAERHARNVVYRARSENPGAFVVLEGCLATRLKRFPQVDFFKKQGPDLVVENADKEGLAGVLSRRFRLAETGHARPIVSNRRLLKVQEGCSRNCAYCIVPMVRGRSRSIGVQEVVEGVRAIEASGASEVVLTGTHLGMYGWDLRPRTDLAGLVRAILDGTEHILLRLSSVEPEETSMALLEVFAHHRVAPHLHLPLQSGSDRVLRDMNRPYTVQGFMDIVKKARQVAPDIAIGSDVIVGFPTERDEDFQATIATIQAINPMYLHVFRYSPRPGTPALRMGDPVPFGVKRQRSAELMRMSGAFREQYIEALVGRRVRTVFIREARDGLLEGLGDNYMHVLYRGRSRTIAEVMIQGRHRDYAMGVEM